MPGKYFFTASMESPCCIRGRLFLPYLLCQTDFQVIQLLRGRCRICKSKKENIRV
jgi:hypothetical protein